MSSKPTMIYTGRGQSFEEDNKVSLNFRRSIYERGILICNELVRNQYFHCLADSFRGSEGSSERSTLRKTILCTELEPSADLV